MRFALVEALALLGAVAATTVLLGNRLLLDWLDVATLLAQAGAVSICCVVTFYYNDLYDFRIVRSLSGFLSRLLQSFGVALILLWGFYRLFPDARIADGSLFSSLLLTIGLLVPLRAIGYGIMRHRAFADRVLIVGTGALARTLIEEIEARPHYGYRIVGIAGDAAAFDGPPLPFPLLGPLQHLVKIAEETRAHRIIVAMQERRGHMPVNQLLEAQTHGFTVEDGLLAYEHFTGKVAIEALTPSHLLFSPGFRKTPLQLAIRRAEGLVAALLGLFLTAPLMALIVVAIKLDSKGPVVFVQERAGRRGRPFRLFKFRTMREASVECQDSVWDRDDSSRITRVGRWIRPLRLDELPQFWNILKGDMDLVGPRPEIMDNVRAMTEQIPYYSLRQVIRPGLTGWAQVRAGYSVNLNEVTEKMRFDLFYIKRMSFWLDLRILVDTVKIVLSRQGAR